MVLGDSFSEEHEYKSMNIIEMLVKVGYPFNYYQMFLKCCLLDIYELEKGMLVIRADGASLNRKENGMSKMDGEIS